MTVVIWSVLSIPGTFQLCSLDSHSGSKQLTVFSETFRKWIKLCTIGEGIALHSFLMNLANDRIGHCFVSRMAAQCKCSRSVEH